MEDDSCNPPWNFSWVLPGELAAMSCPSTPANLRYLLRENIRHLVTLSPERRPPVHAFPELRWTEIKIEEFAAPTITDIRKFIDVCEKARERKQPVGVHCRMGVGRTGVMLACYLVRFYNQRPATAVTNIRLMRPYSIETPQQERVVHRYYDYLLQTSGDQKNNNGGSSVSGSHRPHSEL